MTDPSPNGDDLKPEVWAQLEASLDTYQREHERAFLPPSSPDEVELHQAMQLLQRHAFALLTTGQAPGTLEQELASFQPGATVSNKVLDLLRYNVVQHRLEFDVAWEVVGRLKKVSSRLQIGILAYALLLRSEPSETAIKFFRKGCGAVSGRLRFRGINHVRSGVGGSITYPGARHSTGIQRRQAQIRADPRLFLAATNEVRSKRIAAVRGSGQDLLGSNELAQRRHSCAARFGTSSGKGLSPHSQPAWIPAATIAAALKRMLQSTPLKGESFFPISPPAKHVADRP
jgi:hypothetical protein